MKHIIYFLVVFGALLAHAQEMDTTFFVNEQGQTIGIVKPKEEQAAPAPAPAAKPAEPEEEKAEEPEAEAPAEEKAEE